MESGIDPRLALGAAEQQELAARRGMAENLAQGGADDEAKRAKMRQACEGFESIFIQKMWEQMRATLPKEGLMKSKEEEFWMSMYDQELAKSVANAGGIGLADMMMAQMSRNDANMGEASRISPPRRTALNVQPAPLLPSADSNTRSGTDAASPVADFSESSPAGVFTRAAEKRSSPANPAMPSIYDGEAPAEGAGGAAVEQAAEMLPGALPARAEVSSAPAAGNMERGTQEAAAVPASGIPANDPVRQTLDELRNTVAASARGSGPNAAARGPRGCSCVSGVRIQSPSYSSADEGRGALAWSRARFRIRQAGDSACAKRRRIRSAGCSHGDPGKVSNQPPAQSARRGRGKNAPGHARGPAPRSRPHHFQRKPL